MMIVCAECGKDISPSGAKEKDGNKICKECEKNDDDILQDLLGDTLVQFEKLTERKPKERIH